MLPVILGTVALGTIGYGIKKCLNDENCTDVAKDKISDGAEALYRGIEKLEEKMGLNEFEFEIPFVDAQNQTSIQKNISTDMFEKLYELKLSIVKNLNIDGDDFKIKKDKTQDVTLTQEMITNLHSYNYILAILNKKLTEMKVDEDTPSYLSYVDTLKNLCDTKIIKKGKLNDDSTTVILKAMRVVLGEKELRHVVLDFEKPKVA